MKEITAEILADCKLLGIDVFMDRVQRKRFEFMTDFKTLISKKANFKFKASTYSSEITTESGLVIFYSNETIRFQVFNHNKILKKELKPELDFFKTKKSDLIYFLSNRNYDFNQKTAYFDIKSAYLTVLFNSGKISKDIFDKISNLEKKERLICLGLLAYEPCFFEYENGILKASPAPPKNEFSDCFFYCVKQVSDVMKQCVAFLQKDFAFFWVDGIFFVDTEENKFAIREIFKTAMVNFTEESTEIVSVTHEEKGISLEIKYKNKAKPKNFFLPDSRENKKEFEARIAEIYRQQGKDEAEKELEKFFVLDRNNQIAL